MTISEQAFEPLAQVAVKVGVHLQPNQKLWIMASPWQSEAAHAVARAAYDVGARSVSTLYTDAHIDRLAMERAPEDALTEFPGWIAEGLLKEAEAHAAFLSITDADPDGFRGVPPERVALQLKSAQAALYPFAQLTMAHKVAWSIIAAPSPGWAAKMFPDRSPQEAIDALWKAILNASRADGPDPIADWEAHIEALQARKTWLNGLGIERLHYTAPGTDLTISLPATHQWVSSGEQRSLGYGTSPNIPTEEVFTLPLRNGVTGTVRSTKPLSHNGQMIEGLELRFESGRIVEHKATAGEEALRQIIQTDEGSYYLGEVSLVPVDSPISASGLLFYSTLFDENASCHLAIGGAYPTCLSDGAEVTNDKDLLAKGGNASLTHVDFMIGSELLEVTAVTRDGRTVPVMKDGKWASAPDKPVP